MHWQATCWITGSINNVEASSSESGGKLVLYRQIKHFPETEPYCRASLFCIRLLALFFGGQHDGWIGCSPNHCQWVFGGCWPDCGLTVSPQIELGRYTSQKTPLNMRICKLCNDGIEDQEHFLFHCRALTKPRNEFFCRIQTLNPDFLSYTLLNKRQYLLCPQQHIHCIAHGIYCMYTFRQNLLSIKYYTVNWVI